MRINLEIREDITRAEAILKEARKRLNAGDPDKLVIEAREKNLANCFNLLQDVKQV